MSFSSKLLHHEVYVVMETWNLNMKTESNSIVVKSAKEKHKASRGDVALKEEKASMKRCYLSKHKEASKNHTSIF